MKKSDLASIVLIASLSIIVAFFATNALFEQVATEEVTVKTIDPITTEIVAPNEAIFNENAINPTVEVQINSGTE